MNINSSNISLELAHRLTDVVNAAWENGEMLEKVTPTTASLLKYWFGEGFCEQRQYLQPIITQYFIDNKSEIWLLFLIAHSKR